MNTPSNDNRGLIFVSIALLLATLLMGTWMLYGPAWPSEYTPLKILDSAILALAVTSLVLALLGTHSISKAGVSLPTAILSTVSVLANAIVLVYAAIELITGEAGVMGQ